MFAVDKSFDRDYLMYDVELQTARLSLSDLRDFLKFSFQSFGELQIQAAQKLDLSFGRRPFFPNTSQDDFKFG